jgi:hypothetical protein
MKSQLSILCAALLCVSAPSLSYANGGRSIKGDFIVVIAGVKGINAWSKTVKHVVKITFGRNFVILETEHNGGYSFHQKNITNIRWEPLKAQTTIVKKLKKTHKKALKPDPEKLEKDIDALYAKIENSIDKSDYDKLLGYFKQLNGLMDQYAKSGKKIDPKRFPQSAEFKEIAVALQLQVYVNEGNRILKEMAEDLKKNYNGKAIRAFEKKMKPLLAKMGDHKDETYTRHSEALFFKAQGMYKRAIANLKKKH